jgi:tetratricopeptide (TPR) repeat protein
MKILRLLQSSFVELTDLVEQDITVSNKKAFYFYNVLILSNILFLMMIPVLFFEVNFYIKSIYVILAFAIILVPLIRTIRKKNFELSRITNKRYKIIRISLVIIYMLLSANGLYYLFSISFQSTNPSKNLSVNEVSSGFKNSKATSNYDNKKSNFSIEVIKLNYQATLLVQQRNESSYLKAISLLDKAIEIDSSFHTAYASKADVLCKLGKHNEAIDLYNYIVTYIKPEYPEIYSMLGMLYEKIGNEPKAYEFYEIAIRQYSDRIRINGNILDMVNKAFINYIIDKNEGLKEIDSLILAYPNNIELPMYKEYMFLQYDHQKTIDDL